MPPVFETTDSDRETSAQKQKGPEEQKFRGGTEAPWTACPLWRQDAAPSEGDGVWTRHNTAGARQGQLPIPLMAQQRQMKGVSQEAGGGVWFALDSEEAASVQCRPAGPRSRPTKPKDTHTSALPDRSDSVGQTGEPPGNHWQNTPSG